MKKISKVHLLILDEFLLTTISECEGNDLFEVIQSRTDKKINDLLQSMGS